MKEKKIKVLIIDDIPVHHIIYARGIKESGFGYRVELLSVFSLEEGRKIITLHPDAGIIAIDAEPLNISSALFLVVEIREELKYTGPLISISHHPSCQEGLQQAGCDIVCPQKNLLVEKIIELINSPSLLRV